MKNKNREVYLVPELIDIKDTMFNLLKEKECDYHK